MLSSYPVACPYEGCAWTGSLVPSHLQGGSNAEIPSRQPAWFHCPSCQRDWQVRITADHVTLLFPAEVAG